jgi:hypothetical protein
MFDEQDQLESHQREANECEIQPISPRKGQITAVKEAELKKKHHGTKYDDIYRILFPSDPCPPSPCKFTSIGRFSLERDDAHALQITMMTKSASFKILLSKICLYSWKASLILSLPKVPSMERRSYLLRTP